MARKPRSSTEENLDVTMGLIELALQRREFPRAHRLIIEVARNMAPKQHKPRDTYGWHFCQLGIDPDLEGVLEKAGIFTVMQLLITPPETLVKSEVATKRMFALVSSLLQVRDDLLSEECSDLWAQVHQKWQMALNPGTQQKLVSPRKSPSELRSS